MNEYKGLILDQFQIDALTAINKDLSVIVSAPTGTGKTLVADYLVEKSLKNNKRIIYTAPIKALSNQKFKDFTAQFGYQKVGILTGDIVINPEASLLIMTTEIFRNQVITEDPELNNVSYVIFDEIHWLNDEDRGTVWEESIILTPAHIKILGLSATIANAAELTQWIKSIRGEEVILIEEQKRIVPLDYYYFTKDTGAVTYEQLIDFYSSKIRSGANQDGVPLFKPTTHLDLIESIKFNYLPALYFVFSRKQCSEKAHELANTNNFLTPIKSGLVKDLFVEQFGTEDNWSSSTRKLFRVCRKGIAYHHAGLLPSQKSIVEDLFLQKYISVLYCTETFSVGINYPVKAVCFDSLRKFDGRDFRELKNHEFFQMSGRAGRRGIDEKGYSFAVIDLNFLYKNTLPKFNINKLEPLASQFKLSFNTVLNLMGTLNFEQVEIFFKKSFASYSHLITSERLHSRLQKLDQEYAAIRSHSCDHINSYRCPAIYYPKLKELDRLRKSYNRLEAKRKNKIYGKEMLRKIKKWEKVLQTSPQKCAMKKQENCKTLSAKWREIKSLKSDLQLQLSSLTDHNTFLNEFSYKKNQLAQLKYIENDLILPRGEFARHIYVQEILVTELIFSGYLEALDDDQLNALISCIDYENKKNDFFIKENSLDFSAVKDVIQYIQSICGADTVRFESRVAVITYSWSKGAEFSQISQLCNLDEGDIIAVYRRTIDLLRQIKDATTDPLFKKRITGCMKKLDRDEASILDM